MTTPIQRLTRLLNEGARFKVELPGQLPIDLTPDVIAALEEVKTSGCELHSLTLDKIADISV